MRKASELPPTTPTALLDIGEGLINVTLVSIKKIIYIYMLFYGTRSIIHND